jgi:non-specific serine/threonine protein kinase
MYHIHFGNVEKEELNNITPEVSIHLKERGDYLLFQPIFSYQGFEVRAIDKDKIIVPLSDKILMIQRNLETEARIISKIESLHSGFVRPEQNDLLALKGSEVLKNNWFFLFVDAVKDMSIPVFGFEALKNFRFNTAKPSTKIFISSNTDWFDAKVEIHFGEQKVSVEDVKKALAKILAII